MTHNTPRTDSRTKYEATLDVRFGLCYNDMNARLYRRFDSIFGFVGLFGGSGALIAAIGGYKPLGIVAGALVAALAVIERLVRPIEKAVLHDDFKARYASLNARMSDAELPDIERDLVTLQAQAPSGFHALKLPAYNANLLANGRPDYMANTSRWQRFMALLA